MKNSLSIGFALTCGACFVASAVAAPKPPANVWAAAKAAWTSQARAHGYTAVCSTWRAGDPEGLRCDFGDGGLVTLSLSAVPGVYRAAASNAAERTYVHVDVNARKRGWTRGLPDPWQ